MPRSSGDRKPLALSQGDPAGVGIQASLEAWTELNIHSEFAFYVRGSASVFADRKDQFGIEVPLQKISSPEQALDCFGDALPILDSGEDVQITAGQPDVSSAPSIIKSIEDSAKDVWRREAAAIVTNPIAKSLLYKAGFRHPGHTEFLAFLASQFTETEEPLPIMMLVGGGLKVSLATIHIPLMSVAAQLTTDHIARVGRIVLHALKQDFSIDAPKLGVCGLNPHAGEDGTIGEEDRDIIQPAIKILQSEGFSVSGPRPGDTVFHEALVGDHDAVIAMYHDQGLIPVKTLDIWGGVNVTLGLPFVRTSPDHGTGYDAAAKGKVKADSLISAIKLARQMADNRAQQVVSE